MDADGKIYVVGLAGTGFPVTSGAYQETYGGGVSDAVVARLSSDGSRLEYATYLGGGGSDGDYWARITLGTDGSVYVVGNTTSNNFPTTQGAYSRSLKGGSDLFIARLRLNGQGSQDLLYSTYIGGSGEESGLISGIAVDTLGNVYVAGQTGSTDFPTKNPDPFFNSLCTVLDPCQPNPGQTTTPPGCSQESAILVTLPPGGYTAIVSGVGGTTGVGLVEVFEISP